MNNKGEKMQIIPEFKVGSPLKKLNFDENNINMLAGMYLITNENFRDVMERNIDDTDINRDTYLFFEPRHIYEVFGIINGIFIPIRKNVDDKSIGIDDYREFFFRNLGGQCIKVDTFKKATVSFVDRFMYLPEKLRETLKYLLYYVWLLPYDKIDAMIRQAVEELDKGSADNGTEKSDGKND